MYDFRPNGYLLVAVCLAAAGCSGPANYSSETVAEHRSRLLLASEPEGAATVLDVRETLLGRSEGSGEHDHDQAHPSTADQPPADSSAGGANATAESNEERGDHHGHEHDEGHDHSHADHSHANDGHHGPGVELPTPAQEVVMVGQIGGLANPWVGTQPNFPFVQRQAKFFLADPGAVAEASGHVHAPGEECAFCAAHAADNAEQLAMVQFEDDRGTILPVDVPTLFGVTEGATVVVRGQARVLPGGILVVTASGLYVRE